jgi:hypothetical protein
MKSCSQPSFFRVFDLLLGAGNPGLKLSSWARDSVGWERERHSFAGANHGQTIEIVTVTRPGKRGWSIMVVKEYWWGGKENKPLKMLRWAKPISGQRAHIIEWFRDQELALNRRLAPNHSAPQTANIEGEIQMVSEIDES